MRASAVKTERARELRRQMTEAEQVLWQHLRNHQMQGLHFRRQYVLHGFIADFYCAAARLAIEVDGAIHDQQAEYDHERDIVLTSDGIHILRVTNDEVQHHLDAVLSRIRACCGESTLRTGESHAG